MSNDVERCRPIPCDRFPSRRDVLEKRSRRDLTETPAPNQRPPPQNEAIFPPAGARPPASVTDRRSFRDPDRRRRPLLPVIARGERTDGATAGSGAKLRRNGGREEAAPAGGGAFGGFKGTQSGGAPSAETRAGSKRLPRKKKIPPRSPSRGRPRGELCTFDQGHAEY